MVCNLIDFPTIEETLDMIDHNRQEIDILQARLVELRIKEERRKEPSNYTNRKGMTYEDLFGQEKASEIKRKISDKIRGTRSGKNNPTYKHGKTNFCSKVRRMIEYKRWRSSIYQRDNWTCQTCGVRGGDLEVHHIIPFGQIIKGNLIESFNHAIECDELWDIDNGVTLCRYCHNLTKKNMVLT